MSGKIAKRPLDELWDNAMDEGLEDQIIDAVDEEGDSPLHIACEFGNADVVQWMLNKTEMACDVNILNSNGLTALFLVCLKGYAGADGVGANSQSIKQKRLQITKMLVEKGADLNFTREVVELTPLHWAAYNNDAELVRYLLANKARQIESAAGSMPVDIAGFTGHKKVFKVFMEHVAAKVDAHKGMGPGAEEINLEKDVHRPVFDELTILKKLPKS